MSDRESQRDIRPTSLRRSLLWLVFICVVPSIALGALFAVDSYRRYQRQIHAETQQLAERVIGEVDREFAGIESGLKILASSETLRRGDLRRFYQIAKDAVGSQIIYNYILTDRNGIQVFNTLVPFGHSLPRTGTPPQLAKVFVERETVLSDFFIGPVTGKPAIAMGVPVVNAEGEVVYSLNIGLAPDRLAPLLKNQPLADGWLAALLDTSGVIVCRTREESLFVGKKAVTDLHADIVAHGNGTIETLTKEGIDVISSYATSKRWGWAVAVGAPKKLVETQLRNTVMFIVLTAAVILAAATWIAFSIIRKLTHSVEALNAAAQAIQDGKTAELPRVQLVEAEAIGRAIVRASELSSEVHYKAYHDALTELANRSLFYEFLANSLARAQRSGEPFSLLMVDLDDFKRINDHDGHAAGDTVLRSAAQRIRGEIRKEDLAARLGGDEFAVLLINSEGGAVMEVARRISQRLALPYAGCNTPTSASIGVVSWHAGFSNGADMLEMADQALYRAKAKGKNTISL